MRRFINNVIFQKISRLEHPERLELNLIWVQVAGLNPHVWTSLLLQTLRARSQEFWSSERSPNPPLFIQSTSTLKQTFRESSWGPDFPDLIASWT